MTVSLDNRRKLEEAIARLADGTIKPPDGKLTWKNVAAVAGVSKATADRAVDLRDEFRRQIDTTPPPPDRPQKAPRSRTETDQELAKLRRENAELKRSTKVLHSVILGLTQENQRIRRHRRHDDDTDLILLNDSSSEEED